MLFHYFFFFRVFFLLGEKMSPPRVPFGLSATHKLKEGKANMYTRRIALTRLAKDTLMQMNGAKRKRWGEGGTAHERERKANYANYFRYTLHNSDETAL